MYGPPAAMALITVYPRKCCRITKPVITFCYNVRRSITITKAVELLAQSSAIPLQESLHPKMYVMYFTNEEDSLYFSV